MKTNEIKKGMLIRLSNGWYGIMADNMRGNTRMVKVQGDFTELGSVYSHDIQAAWPNVILDLKDATLPFQQYIGMSNYDYAVKVEHTSAQLKLKKQVDLF